MAKNKNKQNPVPRQKTIAIEPKKTFGFYLGNETLQKAEKPLLKKVFYSVFILMVLLTFTTGFNSSFHHDEMDMNAYGKANLEFYSSLGSDTSYLAPMLEDGTKIPNIIRNYGGLFDNLACSVNSMFGIGGDNEYNTRHMICQAMGLTTILIAGLLMLLLGGGYLGGTITILLLFCTPAFFGHTIFNTKDIPFALGYTLSIYAAILYIRLLPKFEVRPFVLLSIGIALATGVRIGGIILIGLIAFFMIAYLMLNKSVAKQVSKERMKHLMAFIAAIGGGLLIAILNWPFALSDPIANISEALKVVSRFPQKIPLMFEGEYMHSLRIPWYYAIKWMSISIPVMILLLFFASLVYAIINYRKPRMLLFGFVFVAACVPVFYAMYSKMALYSAWRHLLFVYPLMVVFASLFLTDLLSKLTGNLKAPVSIAVCLVVMAHPIYWSVRNHPFEYTYFNELSGGFEKNYYEYETDYWQVGIQEGLKWLYEHEQPQLQKDVVIGTNALPVTRHLMKYRFNDTSSKVVYTGMNSISIVKWKYLLLNAIFLNDNKLTNYPPHGTIHTINVDGKPVCAIVKRIDRKDYEAFEAMNKGQYKLADSLATLYLKEDPQAEQMYEVAAVSRSFLKDWENSFAMCKAGLERFPKSQKLLYYTGMYYGIHQDYRNAARYLELSIQEGLPPSKTIYKQLANIYHILHAPEKAAYYYQLSK